MWFVRFLPKRAGERRKSIWTGDSCQTFGLFQYFLDLRLELRCQKVEGERERWRAKCLELEETNRQLQVMFFFPMWDGMLKYRPNTGEFGSMADDWFTDAVATASRESVVRRIPRREQPRHWCWLKFHLEAFWRPGHWCRPNLHLQPGNWAFGVAVD